MNDDRSRLKLLLRCTQWIEVWSCEFHELRTIGQKSRHKNLLLTSLRGLCNALVLSCAKFMEKPGRYPIFQHSNSARNTYDRFDYART